MLLIRPILAVKELGPGKDFPLVFRCEKLKKLKTAYEASWIMET